MTYQELQDDLIAWLNREGFQELIDTAPSFIRLAENRIARELDLFCFEKVLTGDTTNTTVPSDWMRSKTITLKQGENHFEVNGATHKKVMQSGTNGRPMYYSIVNETFYWGPTPNQVYDFEAVYFAKLPPLSQPTDTNWVTENSPELLLWAALVEACLFLKDDQRGQVWEGRYADLVDKTMKANERRDLEGGALAVREQVSRYLGNKRIY